MKMKLIQDWSKYNKVGKDIEINAIKYDNSFSGHYAVRAKLGKWIWVSIGWFQEVKTEPVKFVKLS